MVPNYGPETTVRAPAPGAGKKKGKPYRVGVLFVHGMGEQERGDTVTEMGDALTDWLGSWLAEVPGADFRIRGAQLRTGETIPSGTPDDAVAGQAHVSVTIISGPGEDEEQEWLLAESWWAAAFRQATVLEVLCGPSQPGRG